MTGVVQLLVIVVLSRAIAAVPVPMLADESLFRVMKDFILLVRS